MKLRWPVRRDTLGKDAVAGLVLGVESVPDGLAAGLLAGVNPLSGLYAYMFGTIGGSFFGYHHLGGRGRAGLEWCRHGRGTQCGSPFAAAARGPGAPAGPFAGDPGGVPGVRRS